MNTYEGTEEVAKAIGKEIVSIEIGYWNSYDDCLIIRFEDSRLVLFDNKRLCCESRWMSTDDDLLYYTGSYLTDVRVLEAGYSIEVGAGYKDVMFLAVDTSVGTFVCASYNRHNGYYGGFNIVAVLDR